MNDKTEGKTVFHEINNSFDDPEIEEKISDLFNLCITMNQIYATSFTINGNQLSQWRGYCPDEGGYSIGFDFDEIDKMIIKKPSLSDDAEADKVSSKEFKLIKTAEEFLGKSADKLIFDYCVYSNEDVFKDHIQVLRDHVHKVVNEFSNEQIKALKRKNPYESIILLANEKGNKILNFILRISKIVALYKDSSFSEEEEYRLMYVDKSGPSKPFIRAKRSYPLPFMKAKFHQKAIKEIIIGPTKYKELAWNGLVGLLNSNDLKIKIKESEIPYRS